MRNKTHGSHRTFEAQGVVTEPSIRFMDGIERASYISSFIERSVQALHDKAAEEEKTLIPDTLETHYEVDPEGNHHFRLTARSVTNKQLRSETR